MNPLNGIANLAAKGFHRYINELAGIYNWTLGRDKYQMSKDLAIAGAIAGSAPIIVHHPVAGIIFASVHCIIAAYQTVKGSVLKEEEREEQEVKSSKARTIHLESAIIGTCLSLPGITGITSENTTEKYLGAGLLLQGHADYILLADNLPKRKDIIRRSIDGLTKKLQEKPLTKPI